MWEIHTKIEFSDAFANLSIDRIESPAPAGPTPVRPVRVSFTEIDLYNSSFACSNFRISNETPTQPQIRLDSAALVISHGFVKWDRSDFGWKQST